MMSIGLIRLQWKSIGYLRLYTWLRHYRRENKCVTVTTRLRMSTSTRAWDPTKTISTTCMRPAYCFSIRIIYFLSVLMWAAGHTVILHQSLSQKRELNCNQLPVKAWNFSMKHNEWKIHSDIITEMWVSGDGKCFNCATECCCVCCFVLGHVWSFPAALLCLLAYVCSTQGLDSHSVPEGNLVIYYDCIKLWGSQELYF